MTVGAALDRPADYLDLSDYTGVLRRRWRAAGLLCLLGVAVAGGYLLVAPAAYTATVLVQVNALPSDANAVGGRTAGPVNMDNEAQVAQSGAVAALVRARLHSALPVADIASNISVTVPPNSTFLQVGYSAPAPRAARRWAAAVASAYLSQRRATAEAIIGTGIAALRQQEAGLRATIEKLRSLIGSGQADPAARVRDELLLADAQDALSSAAAHIDEATPLYDSLAAPGSVIVGSIVTPPDLPTAPSSPRALLVLPSGLALGLLTGLALAFARDRGDARVRSAAEAERIAGVSALLDLAAGRRPPADEIAQHRSEPGRAFGELARHVCAALGGGQVIVVAATAPGECGSVVAANLAAALARTTDETVLICGDAAQTGLPELLGVDRGGLGLSDALAGRAAAPDVLRSVAAVPRLRLVTPGLTTSGGGSAIRYAAAARLLAGLLETARFLVIEVHSVQDAAGTFPLAEFGEQAILAVELDGSRPAHVAACGARLDRLRVPVLGTVIVPARPGGTAGSAWRPGPLRDLAARRRSGSLRDLAARRRPGPIAAQPGDRRLRASAPAAPSAARPQRGGDAPGTLGAPRAPLPLRPGRSAHEPLPRSSAGRPHGHPGGAYLTAVDRTADAADCDYR